ncbi:uncharacterized protein JCM10292_002846 [Rhodotorula paludigena]|uniref:uncharacterized protein n=1 Tax=Rhodotorula paludigena TaxID=86838 RepID=UPI00317D5A2F
MSIPASFSSPRAVSLLSLPNETLKQIVDLVNAQDKCFGFARSTVTRSVYGRSEIRTHSARHIPNGAEMLWSYWHGRGVAALSCVNKQLRRLALPVLLETLTRKQCIKQYALYRLPRTPAAAMVQHLDLRLGRYDYYESTNRMGLLPLAALLHQLPSLTRLTLDEASGAPTALDPAEVRVREELHEAFVALAPRIRSLAVYARNEKLLEILERCTSPAALESLVVHSPINDPLIDEGGRLPALLSGLCLQHLAFLADYELGSEADSKPGPDELDAEVPPVWFITLAPTLRSFTYRSERLLPAGLIRLIATAFPNLEQLSLTTGEPQGIELSDRLSVETLPNLRRLTLQDSHAWPDDFVHHFFRLVTLPALETLVVTDVFQPPNCRLVATLLSALPPSVRNVVLLGTMAPKLTVHHREIANIVALAARQGVRIDFPPASPRFEHLEDLERRTDIFGPLSRSIPSDLHRLHDGIVCRSVNWLREHYLRVVRTGDDAGLAELAQLCEPLRMREFIEKE